MIKWALLLFVGLSAAANSPYIYDVRSAWVTPVPISDYDEVLRRVGVREGVDWRLLSAIACHESNFNEDVVSPMGARGLMQVRPVVARHFGVSTATMSEVETNVMLAARLLRTIEKGLELPCDLERTDRLSLMLACYNAGERPVASARHTAQGLGLDPNLWEHVAPLLRRGETSAFVRKVTDQYDQYCRVATI